MAGCSAASSRSSDPRLSTRPRAAELHSRHLNQSPPPHTKTDDRDAFAHGAQLENDHHNGYHQHVSQEKWLADDARRRPRQHQRDQPQCGWDTVTRISADVSREEKSGQSYYTIRIGISPEEIARLGDVRLVPGMPVETFMKTHDRTVISYLTKPLHD